MVVDMKSLQHKDADALEQINRQQQERDKRKLRVQFEESDDENAEEPEDEPEPEKANAVSVHVQDFTLPSATVQITIGILTARNGLQRPKERQCHLKYASHKMKDCPRAFEFVLYLE